MDDAFLGNDLLKQTELDPLRKEDDSKSVTTNNWFLPVVPRTAETIEAVDNLPMAPVRSFPTVEGQS